MFWHSPFHFTVERVWKTERRAHFWYTQHKQPALITCTEQSSCHKLLCQSLQNALPPYTRFTIQNSITHRFCTSCHDIAVFQLQFLMFHPVFNAGTSHPHIPPTFMSAVYWQWFRWHTISNKKGNRFWHGNRNTTFETATVICVGTERFCAWIPHFSKRFQLCPTLEK